MSTPRDPVGDLEQIAFLLEREHAPTYRVQAFRKAAAMLGALPPGELRRRVARRDADRPRGDRREDGRPWSSSRSRGRCPRTCARSPPARPPTVATGGEQLRALLKGDLHTHSDWSDGGSGIEEMARAAGDVIGHSYVALTDHSPRLRVANGLDADRLRAQLEVVAELNSRLAPFRILTGIEVDILDDGALDQDPALLDRLDVVVASCHSKLRMEREAMTRRMVAAVANPHVDVLGHCTGRIVGTDPSGKRGGRGGRPESEFDAELVFAACAQFGVAVEINSRPERLDPPRRLLHLAIESGCLFSVDSDAHAPGQLDWQPYGCARAVECEVDPAQVVNTWDLDTLLNWTGRHR